MTTADQNLAALRAYLVGDGLDAIIIGREGAFACEETQAHEERLAWLTGFSGSAGLAVVTATAAVLFSDGRYALQMRGETSDAWECCDYSDGGGGLWSAVAGWLVGNVASGRVGYDGSVLVVAARNALCAALAKTSANIDLVMLAGNPIDALWGKQRPTPHTSTAWDVAPKHHGLVRGDKMALVAGEVRQAGGDALLITDPCELAWLLNIRGGDLTHTPVVCAHALLLCDADPRLIVFHHKPETALAEIDKAGITFAPSDSLLPTLAKLTKDKKRVWCDPQKSAVVLYEALAKPIVGESPIVMRKAQKNENEAAGFRAAHKQDAVAVMRFLHWLSRQNPLPSESEAAEYMAALRGEGEGYIGDSFAAISASGSNGAIIHYQARAGKDRKLARGALYLLDSGGHYYHYHRGGGTTDITRTIYIGDVGDGGGKTKDMSRYRHAYTHVLKSHIALATQIFREGTTGAQLDGVARSPLWQAGLDYPHGTGHGVGACLSVHEGPVHISKHSTRPLVAGLVLSNEPGVYVAGKFGVRLENLMLVVRHPKHKAMLQFETLTQVPFDRQLIDRALLTEGEREWLNSYHHKIHQQFASVLAGYDGDGEGESLTAWLARVTAPI